VYGGADGLPDIVAGVFRMIRGRTLELDRVRRPRQPASLSIEQPGPRAARADVDCQKETVGICGSG
jgi:hypothetical protein